MLSLCMLLSALLASTLSVADTSLPHTVMPTPSTALYKMTWQSGITLSGKATIALVRVDDHSNEMALTMDASVLAASLNERSHFHIINNKVMPIRYDFKQRALFHTQKHTIAFDQHLQQTTINQKQRVQFEQGPILDKLSLQLQLQLDAQQAYQQDNNAWQQPFTYTVATDENTPSRYVFAYQGEALLNLPLGQVNAVKFKRTQHDKDNDMYIWLAPSLDFQIVRILRREADGDTFELLLENLSN